MKITDIKLITLEDPERKSAYVNLYQVPDLRRIQYTHGSKMQPSGRNLRQSFLKVITDEGVESMCTCTMPPDQIETLRHQVIGENPLNKEGIYQMLHKGTRWVYQRHGWFGETTACGIYWGRSPGFRSIP